MSDAARTTAAVLLLVDDEAARRLLVSWPLVPARLAGKRMVAEWARVSGVPLVRTQRLAEALFAHQLVRADRTVDPEAARVVQHFAAERLRAAQKGRR